MREVGRTCRPLWKDGPFPNSKGTAPHLAPPSSQASDLLSLCWMLLPSIFSSRRAGTVASFTIIISLVSHLPLCSASAKQGPSFARCWWEIQGSSISHYPAGAQVGEGWLKACRYFFRCSDLHRQVRREAWVSGTRSPHEENHQLWNC